MVARIIPVDTFDLVIFGSTGDLARRKIFPALLRRYVTGQFPDQARILGASRSDMSDNEFREMIKEGIVEFGGDDLASAPELDDFLNHISYLQIDARGDDGWAELAGWVRHDVVQAFYFSVAPALFGDIAKRLHNHEISGPDARIVVEKPFGHDLQSAKALNAVLAEHFQESQIYRIDHYLGKETVQNLMAVRFGNLLFEPMWDAQHIDHIQITAAETVGVGGRGAYYDTSGAMRDMVQNHLLQLLCLIAMEPPAMFEPNAVRDEKLKVIRALGPVAAHQIVRGQYEAADESSSFRDDVENPSSATESFIALKVHVANWRWAGVPFYLRTGKKLSARSSEIAIVFKKPPHSIFKQDFDDTQNVLAIKLQPNEGMTLDVTIKEPGPGGMRLITVPLDMTFAEALGNDVGAMPDAYERLLTDVIRGNQTLFMRGDEVEAAWAWTDPIIAEWEQRKDVPKPYAVGSDGPDDAQIMMTRDGRAWRKVDA